MPFLFSHRAALIGFAAILAACGNHDGMDHADMDHDMSNATTLDSNEMEGDAVMAIATAEVMSVGEDGDFITLDHSAIKEINMGAMRMGFEVADGVDITPYQAGDQIRFKIMATESDLLLTAICRPSTDGADCLPE